MIITKARPTNIIGDTTPPTTEIKIKRNSTDVTGEWLKAGTYTIEFEDHDQAEGGSGLNCENCTCEYSIYSVM